jgi:hypothetical protein
MTRVTRLPWAPDFQPTLLSVSLDFARNKGQLATGNRTDTLSDELSTDVLAPGELDKVAQHRRPGHQAVDSSNADRRVDRCGGIGYR